MIPRILRNSTTISVIISNLLLLIAVIYFKWDALTVFALYIIETIIIGVFHVFKMLIVATLDKLSIYKVQNSPRIGGILFLVVFFIFHFGFFVFVQSALILPTGFGGPITTIKALGTYVNQPNFWVIISFIVINAWMLIRYIFIDNEFEGKEYNDMLMEPYPRIFVQQFVVIFGGAILTFAGMKSVFLIVFILTKTLMELAVASNTLKMTASQNSTVT